MIWFRDGSRNGMIRCRKQFRPKQPTTARAVSGIHNLHDFNCGLKAYRKEVIKNIEVYGEMHRYIPIWQKCRFQQDRRKSGSPPGTKIRKDKIRTEPFRQWLSGLAHSGSCLIRYQADAYLRLPGFYHVYSRFHSCSYHRVNKLYDLYAGNPYRLITDSPYFYLALYNHDYRYTTLPFTDSSEN